MQSSRTFSPTPTTPALRPLIARLVGDEKHYDSAHGTLQAYAALYGRVLRVDPEHPDAPDRDRLLVSKGHGPMAYFAALAHRGYFAPEWLDEFLQFHGRLGGHPDRVLVPGVEASSGSLGHGLPIAVGVALGLRTRNNTTSRVFCLLGDAELDEGSNHEAIAFAGRMKLDQLTALVIDNQSASHGWPGGIAARFIVEAWHASSVDGRDEEALALALDAPSTGAPRVVIATVPPKGA